MVINQLWLYVAGGGSSESEGELGGGAAGAGGARAQYVSANCVVFTHYSGDVAAVVDEHFARALAIDKPKGNFIGNQGLAGREKPAFVHVYNFISLDQLVRLNGYSMRHDMMHD